MEHDSFMDFCIYEAAVLISPLFIAVMYNNVPFLIQLLRTGYSINVQDQLGSTPLHFAIKYKKKQAFDFMLRLENIHLNSQDYRGVTPLMLAVLDGAEYYVFELLKTGVDLNVIDNCCASALHYAIRNSNITEALVAKGADMNIQDWFGHTPLHVASAEWECECVIILLLYGANPHVLDLEDCVPFTHGLLKCPKINLFDWVVLDWLYNYTFDEKTNQISLHIVNVAMLYNPDFFFRFLGQNVVFESSDLTNFYLILYKIDPRIFYVFMKNYKFIVQKLVLHYYTDILEDFFVGKPGSEAICTMLCENNFFVNNTLLVSALNRLNINTFSEDTLAGRLLHLLSYGFTLSETDLQLVYNFYGFGQLFKMLLHMDIFNNNYAFVKPFMPHLIYNMQLNMNLFFKSPYVIIEDFDGLVQFFAYPLLAEYGKRVLKRQSSPVPSLIELSRNCARQNIIKRFRVKNFSQFFTIVKRLPIADVCKAILFYEKAIYPYPELC